jgi:hypothetical protein
MMSVYARLSPRRADLLSFYTLPPSILPPYALTLSPQPPLAPPPHSPPPFAPFFVPPFAPLPGPPVALPYALPYAPSYNTLLYPHGLLPLYVTPTPNAWEVIVGPMRVPPRLKAVIKDFFCCAPTMIYTGLRALCSSGVLDRHVQLLRQDGRFDVLSFYTQALWQALTEVQEQKLLRCSFVTKPEFLARAVKLAEGQGGRGMVFKQRDSAPFAVIVPGEHGTPCAVRSTACTGFRKAANANYCTACSATAQFFSKKLHDEQDMPSDHAALATIKTAISSLPDSDWKHMLEDLAALLITDKLDSGMWLFRQLDLTVKTLKNGDRRAARYPPVMIAYWQCLRYLSGTRAYEYSCGPGNQGAGQRGGRLPIDAKNIINVQALHN